jgi:putative Ca2+/H+ antiporter (TMEM165/GDT1 family)
MIKSMIPIFLTVFLAELGDKTQLATVLFAAEGGRSPWLVFAASALALVLAAAIGVLAGTFAQKYLAMVPLKLIAGIGFMAIGAWVIAEHFRAPTA